jgi:hypothetical protein
MKRVVVFSLVAVVVCCVPATFAAAPPGFPASFWVVSPEQGWANGRFMQWVDSGANCGSYSGPGYVDATGDVIVPDSSVDASLAWVPGDASGLGTGFSWDGAVVYGATFGSLGTVDAVYMQPRSEAAGTAAVDVLRWLVDGFGVALVIDLAILPLWWLGRITRHFFIPPSC